MGWVRDWIKRRDTPADDESPAGERDTGRASTPQPVPHSLQVGRASNVGHVRDHNEDVLLTLEINQLGDQAIAKLHRNEELFRLLVDSVREYAIFMLDAEGRIISWNTGAERLKGYREDEIVGALKSAGIRQTLVRVPFRILTKDEEKALETD